MHKAFAPLILLSGNAIAHPGHGMPGGVHPHVADAALIGFGAFVFFTVIYFIGKALKR